MKKISALVKGVALGATLALLAAPALAQDTAVYTGCIRSADGSLYNVGEGTAPMAPCRAKDKQISWNMAGQPGPEGPPGPSLPRSLEIAVNCNDNSQSINAALTQQAERLTISISGTCVERVFIARDDVTLQGVGENPTIMGPENWPTALVVRGAQRVHVQGLALRGYVEVGNGASFTASQLKISNSPVAGLAIASGAVAGLEESEISGNKGGGVSVSEGSSLMLGNTQVIDNEGCGVFVQGSTLFLGSGTKVARNVEGVCMRLAHALVQGGCTILDNRLGGVGAGWGSHLLLEQCTIAGNGARGIVIHGTSTAILLNRVFVQNNGQGGVVASGGSFVEVGSECIIEGGEAAPGIRLGDTSTAHVGTEEVSITGVPHGIYCLSPPSVAQLVCCTPSTVDTNCLTGL